MENIIRIADDFAKQYKLTLPLRLDTMKRLCDALGYKLLTYAEGAAILEKLPFDDYIHCPAFCTRVMDCNVVFYDDTCSVGTRLFSLAHEIGHIVLRHIATGALGYDASDTSQEREADAFAYALLAPLDALRAARVRTVKQIQRMTLLDRERAAHVLAELQAEQPETPQVKPARPLLIFYTSIGAALALVIASVSVVMYFRTPHTRTTRRSRRHSSSPRVPAQNQRRPNRHLLPQPSPPMTPMRPSRKKPSISQATASGIIKQLVFRFKAEVRMPSPYQKRLHLKKRPVNAAFVIEIRI